MPIFREEPDDVWQGKVSPQLPDMDAGLSDAIKPCFNMEAKDRPPIKDLKQKVTLLKNSLFAASQPQRNPAGSLLAVMPRF